MWSLTKKILGTILGVWILLSIMAFISGILISFLGSPGWLQLPWSDVKDFVETSDGKVFVSLGFYRQVLLYDENGKFIESHPYPYGKHGRLAVDASDNVYFWSNGDVYVYDKYWKQTKIVSKPSSDCECNSWKLDNNEQLIGSNQRIDNQRIDSKAVEKGEVLFPYELRTPTIFNDKNGTTLRRGWFTITRYSADGKTLTEYRTPWYLIWAVFPFPAVLAWPAIFISAGWKKLKNRP